MSLLGIATASPLRRDETVAVALLLAFAGGCLDAYTRIIHGVMANAQTANLVLLWVHGTTDDWARALQFGAPILAFAIGIVLAAWLVPSLALGLPVIALLVVLLRCETDVNGASS
jgi:uncharacterized membrane protein YoaK (UPF0700 family)